VVRSADEQTRPLWVGSGCLRGVCVGGGGEDENRGEAGVTQTRSHAAMTSTTRQGSEVHLAGLKHAQTCMRAAVPRTFKLARGLTRPREGNEGRPSAAAVANPTLDGPGAPYPLHATPGVIPAGGGSPKGKGLAH
jgi:hypothetical protein